MTVRILVANESLYGKEVNGVFVERDMVAGEVAYDPFEDKHFVCLAMVCEGKPGFIWKQIGYVEDPNEVEVEYDAFGNVIEPEYYWTLQQI